MGGRGASVLLEVKEKVVLKSYQARKNYSRELNLNE